MPYIPEEKIDHVLERVDDAVDSVRLQTQAIDMLREHLADLTKITVDVHGAVTKESGDGGLEKLLAEIAETGRANHELLKRLLAKP